MYTIMTERNHIDTYWYPISYLLTPYGENKEENCFFRNTKLAIMIILYICEKTRLKVDRRVDLQSLRREFYRKNHDLHTLQELQ